MIIASSLRSASLALAALFAVLTWCSIAAAEPIAAPQSAMAQTGQGFVENLGQWPDEVLFLHRSPGIAVWLTRDGMVIDRFVESEISTDGLARGGLLKEIARAERRVRGNVLRTRFVNASSSASIEGRSPLEGSYNFFVGDLASQGHAGARSYSEVWYKQIYEGIDIVIRSDKNLGLKYDAIVAPGADPNLVQVSYDGDLGLELTAQGDLRIKTGAGDFIEERPVVYQERDGQRVAVPASYRITDSGTLSYDVGSYDRSRPLVIDPRLSWSTYLGGGGTDAGIAIAMASDGLLVTGFTVSSPFPTTTGVYDRTANGLADSFITKFDTGGRLIFSTLIGGSSDDYSQAIASDSFGNVVITGGTTSSSYPTTPTAYDTSYGGGGFDVFVSKFSANGAALVYSTFLGAAGDDAAAAVVAAESGSAIVAGFTSSPNFPTTPGSFDPTYNGSYEGFITKLNSSGTALLESSFIGGSSDDDIVGMAMGPTNDRVFVGGSTESDDFPVTPLAYDTSINGAKDGFVASYLLQKPALGFATFIGGFAQEYGYCLTVDAMGQASLGGETESFDFPLTAGAFDTELAGLTDGYVSKLNADGSALVFSTFLGGSVSFDYVQSLTPSPSGAVLATGTTFSFDFPVTSGPFGGTPYAGGIADAFVTSLSKNEGAGVYSTCLGGTDGDVGFSIVLGTDARAFTTGYTISADYPTTSGAYDRTWNGGLDTYVTAVPVLTTAPAGKQGSAPHSRGLSLSVTSPARRTIDARIDLPRAAGVVAELLDATGRRVLRQDMGSLTEGASTIRIDPLGAGAEIASGVYYLRLSSDGTSTSRRVILLK